MSTVPSDPVFASSVAVSLGDGQVHFAGISSSGQLWHRWRNNAGQWNDWTYLGAPPEGALNGPIAIANSGGQIHIVAIRNGTVYLRIYNGGWWGWENHGGPITGSVAVADRGGLIHIVGFGSPSPNVYMRWWNLSSWQGWEWLGCCLDDTLAVDNANALRYNTVGTPHVGVHVAAFSSQSAYIRCWDVYCLGSGWDYQGGPAYGGPAALTNTYGEVHLVVRSSLNLYHRWRAP